MKVRNVTVNYERKLNMGNYSSATVGVCMTADLDDGEDPNAVAASLQQLCRDTARNEAMRLMAPATAAS